MAAIRPLLGILAIVVAGVPLAPTASAGCNLLTCAYATATACGGIGSWCYTATGSHSGGIVVRGILTYTNSPTDACDGILSCATDTRDSLNYGNPTCHIATAKTTIAGLLGESSESDTVHC